MKTKRITRPSSWLLILALMVGAVMPALARQAEAQDVVKLSFWNGFTGGDRPAYEALVAQFNATHPNIQVSMDIQPWDTLTQKLPAALATGKGPDLATPDFNVATIRQYAAAGTIAPLDDLYGTGPNQIDPAAMPPAVLDSFRYDDHAYAVPGNFATLQLYYNTDLFAAAGIAAPPATMDEFRADAVKLTTRNGSDNASQYGLALADNQTIAMWPILIWADGGDLLNADGCAAIGDPATVAAVTSWADLVANQGISPVGETGQGADNLFAAGKAAMEMNGPWAAAQYTAAGVNYKIAAIPVGSAGPVTLASTVPIVVSNATKHKAEAYEFLAWWTGRDAQQAFALQSGFPPVRTDMGDDPALAQNPNVLIFAAAAPYARLYLATVDNFAQIDTDIIVPALGRIGRGASPADVLADAAKEMNKLLGC